MIENLNSISEEQANLHIVENMDVNNLPEIMQTVLTLAHTPAEKDMLLMSALVACGSVMPNLYFKYGISAKRYYPNLQLFIVGSAACGKGIAMILTMLRTPSITPELNSGIECSDIDYATAELIGNKLILHMAQAYQLVKGTEKVSLPTVKPLDQKQILLSLLPDEFESKTLVAEAQSQGISRRTAIRWSDEWQTVGLIQKIKYGTYKKIA